LDEEKCGGPYSFLDSMGHRAHVESLAAESRRLTLQNKKLERRNREWEAKVQHEEERENWSEKSKIKPRKSAMKVENDSSEAKTEKPENAESNQGQETLLRHYHDHLDREPMGYKWGRIASHRG